MKQNYKSEEFNFWPSLSDLSITVLFLVILFFFIVVLKLAQSFPTDEIERTRRSLISEMKYALGTDSTILGKDTLIGANHTLIFNSAFLFPEGGYYFKDLRSENMITTIASVIKKYVETGKISRIVIEGHTNSNIMGNDPMGNWTLSSNRAITVVKIFDKIGIRQKNFRDTGPSRLLSISGYSSYDYVPFNDKLKTENLEDSKRIQIFLEYDPRLGK